MFAVICKSQFLLFFFPIEFYNYSNLKYWNVLFKFHMLRSCNFNTETCFVNCISSSSSSSSHISITALHVMTNFSSSSHKQSSCFLSSFSPYSYVVSVCTIYPYNTQISICISDKFLKLCRYRSF
jgi:hypothetical protein